MKRMFGMLLVAGVIFSAAAAGSWFYQQRQPHNVEAPAATVAKRSNESHAAGLVPEPAAPVAGAAGENGLPATVRPRPVSVEELLRYSLGLKGREETVAQREKDLERRQSQLNIIKGDIQGEQRELDGLRAQVKLQLGSVESMLNKLSAEREEFSAERAQAAGDLNLLKSTQATVEAAQWDNVKKMSAWFQSMEPEKAATVLKELANNGKMDLAVQLLSSFEEREAAKVLSSIEDTSLTVDLAEAFREFRKPEKKDEKRR